MKRFLLLLSLAAPIWGQATLTLQVPGEANTTLTVSSDALATLQAAIKVSLPGGIANPTLTQNIVAGTTSLKVSSTDGVAIGMGALIGSEVSLITAVPDSTTLTVVRARIGTSAAAANSGAVVTVLTAGSYGTFVRSILKTWAQANLQAFPGGTVATAQAAIATQNAIIATALAGAIQ